VTRTDNCLVTFHSIIWTVARISLTRFYIRQKTGCGIRSFCPWRRKSGCGCCWDTNQTFMWSNFYWPINFQRITMNKKLSKSLHTWNLPT